MAYESQDTRFTSSFNWIPLAWYFVPPMLCDHLAKWVIWLKHQIRQFFGRTNADTQKRVHRHGCKNVVNYENYTEYFLDCCICRTPTRARPFHICRQLLRWFVRWSSIWCHLGNNPCQFDVTCVAIINIIYIFNFINITCVAIINQCNPYQFDVICLAIIIN